MAGKFNLTDLLNQRSQQVKEETQEREMRQQAAEQPEEKEEIVMVDVCDLMPSKENFYRVDDELKRSIELVGILQPLLVKKPENGKYRVIAGHRRRLAVLSLINEGKEERRFVPCVFKKEDVRDRLAIIMANRFRDKTDWEKMQEAIEAEELAKEIKQEFKLQGRTRAILEEITGVSAAQLGRYKAIYNNLSPELMLEFKENRIGMSVAAEVCGMTEDWQQRAFEKLEQDGGLSLPEVKEMKRQEECSRGIPGQMEMQIETGNREPEEQQEETESEADQQQDEETYFEPQPETVTSICYNCDRYEECHEKKATVQKCNAFVDRKEARKTETQRYEEEQAEIDRETKKKLREQKQNEKMERLPSEQERGAKVHEVKLPASNYDDLASGKRSYDLRKNKDFREGDKLHMLEFKDGRFTGRCIDADIIYILEEYTGLQEDYCILGIKVTNCY